jgi:hypothetical protein
MKCRWVFWCKVKYGSDLKHLEQKQSKAKQDRKQYDGNKTPGGVGFTSGFSQIKIASDGKLLLLGD